ncbi:MAG TPA: SAM-dependent methyltransferase [Chlamydiales bacterium]|nr:SAM-dependent methyltransferase [Chlamydiales bacterium]
MKKSLNELFELELLIQATFSSPWMRGSPSKITIRPIRIKDKVCFQISEQRDTQVFHRNVETIDWEEMRAIYSQGMIYTKVGDYHLLKDKKIISKPPSKNPLSLSHNREKEYLLSEGEPLPFLVELGIMNKEGRVYPQKMDKFRQINRFLEMVADVLPDKKDLHIVEFGCGKAYLTFSLYYYLVHQGIQVKITGIDLKKEIIQFCQNLAEKLKNNIQFKKGEISQFSTHEKVDMVIALHACDTASDRALEKAVEFQAKTILVAPCCQKELYSKISSSSLEGMLRYGIMKERFASLATDAMRALRLEIAGYKTQVLEFIDAEHTPKNLLIRAVFGNKKDDQDRAKRDLEEFRDSLC